MIVAVDLLANALLICGANKDYSGRRKDLRLVLRAREDAEVTQYAEEAVLSGLKSEAAWVSWQFLSL